jgi:hypothetical protein
MNDPFKKIHLRVNPDLNHLENFVWVVHVHVDKIVETNLSLNVHVFL